MPPRHPRTGCLLVRLEVREGAPSRTISPRLRWYRWRRCRQRVSVPSILPHAASALGGYHFTRGRPRSPGPTRTAAWLFYLAEISLRRLNGRLCGEIQILRRDNPRVPRFLEALAEMIPEYEMQAREWAASLPAELSISGGNGMGDEDICRSVLRGHLANLFETVYWPFAVAGLDAIASGRPTSAATREMLGRALSEHVDRLEANEPGFLHRHHGALFMIKSCTRSALVLVAAANLVPAADMPPRWSLVVYKVIGMLAYWSGEVPELGNWKRLLELQMTKANAITS